MTKEYTLTCEDTAGDGWDYVDYKYDDINRIRTINKYFDGFLLIQNTKYCDVFGKKQTYTFPSCKIFLCFYMQQHAYFYKNSFILRRIFCNISWYTLYMWSPGIDKFVPYIKFSILWEIHCMSYEKFLHKNFHFLIF